MSVIILTTGVPGSGKTYVRCARFLVDDFLVNSKAVHISNFPVRVDEVADFVSQKINRKRGIFGIFRKPVTVEDIKNRIEIIPDDVLQMWRSGFSGPWDYFKGRDLKYCHIAIDEIHNFINDRCSDSVLKQWDDFLGEIRHRGCTFEGLTQDVQQVHQVLTGRVSVRLELVPGEDLRDPFFKICMSDWYELKAGFLGSFHKTVFVYEKRKQDTRWKTNHVSRFLITPDYFRFYNSYNASLQEKSDGSVNDDRAPEHEFQKRSRFSLLLWFVRRNFLTLFIRIFLLFLVLWLCFFGGLNFLIRGWMSGTQKMYKSQNPSKTSVCVTGSVASASIPFSSDSRSSRKSSSPPSNTNSVDSFERLKYLEEKRKLIENEHKPALFFDGKCWLQSGKKISVGFVFTGPDEGRFEGKTVIRIDSTDRCYYIDGDVCITMY